MKEVRERCYSRAKAKTETCESDAKEDGKANAVATHLHVHLVFTPTPQWPCNGRERCSSSLQGSGIFDFQSKMKRGGYDYGIYPRKGGSWRRYCLAVEEVKKSQGCLVMMVVLWERKMGSKSPIRRGLKSCALWSERLNTAS